MTDLAKDKIKDAERFRGIFKDFLGYHQLQTRFLSEIFFNNNSFDQDKLWKETVDQVVIQSVPFYIRERTIHKFGEARSLDGLIHFHKKQKLLLEAGIPIGFEDRLHDRSFIKVSK